MIPSDVTGEDILYSVGALVVLAIIGPMLFVFLLFVAIGIGHAFSEGRR